MATNVCPSCVDICDILERGGIFNTMLQMIIWVFQNKCMFVHTEGNKIL